MTEHICPTCNRPWREDDVPPEPPVGTWVKDRYGATTMHHEGGGWAPRGFMPFGKWDAMWRARGPLLVCDQRGDLVEVTNG